MVTVYNDFTVSRDGSGNVDISSNFVGIQITMYLINNDSDLEDDITYVDVFQEYTEVFTQNGTFHLEYDCTVDILIVGGGGAGGNCIGGGGGAGGVVYTVDQSLSAGTYNIAVGNGGIGQGCETDANEDLLLQEPLEKTEKRVIYQIAMVMLFQ